MNNQSLLTRMAAALPIRAAAYLSRYIDPADAFISYRDGLTVEQAHSRARNAARPLGTSWPDDMPTGTLQDLYFQLGIEGDPLEILLAVEAAEAALASADAPQRLALAELDEADTQAMADVFHITQRRAQQIKKEKRALAAAQGVLL